jgi:hypothetical protein
MDTLVRWLSLVHAVGDQHSGGVKEIGDLVWDQCLQVLVAMQLDWRYNDSVRGGTGVDKQKGTVYPLHKLVRLQLHRFYRTGFVVFERPNGRRLRHLCAALIVEKEGNSQYIMHWDKDRWKCVDKYHRYVKDVGEVTGCFNALVDLLQTWTTDVTYRQWVILPYISPATLMDCIDTPHVDQWLQNNEKRVHDEESQ